MRIIGVGIFCVETFQVLIFLGGRCPDGSFSGWSGNVPGVTYPGWECSLVEVFRVGHIRVALFWVGLFMLTYFFSEFFVFLEYSYLFAKKNISILLVNLFLSEKFHFV